MGQVSAQSSADAGFLHDSKSQGNTDRNRHGNHPSVARLLHIHRMDFYPFMDGSKFTVHDIGMSRSQLAKMYNNGGFTRHGPDPESESNANQYTLSDNAMSFLGQLQRGDDAESTICPCPCPVEGVHNIKGGGYACPKCGTEFERHELRE